MIDRREFSVTLGLAAAAGLVRPRALFGAGQRATVFEWHSINDSMHVAFGAGGNVLALVDGGSLLLFDAKHIGYGEALRREAESFGGSLRAVVSSHHHPDHIGSNPFFTDEVPVIGHTRGVPRAAAFGEQTIARIMDDPIGRLESMLSQVRNLDISSDAKSRGSDSMTAFVSMIEEMEPSAFAATVTFDRELERSVGGTRVELRHIDRGHTDNDIFAFFPDANVIHGGDLFFNGLHPRIDVSADATTVGWQRCINAMIELADDDTVCIPGHGPLSDIGGLRAFHEYFDILRAFVRRHIDEGRSREQIVEMDVPQFAEWDSARLPANLGTIYDELTSGR